MNGSTTLDRVTRREMLGAAVGLSLAWSFPTYAAMRRLTKAIRIAVIADLHHDVVHDGLERMTAFVKAVKAANPDAIMQVGDFAYPNAQNRHVIDSFNQAHERRLHVIGNHDTDDGHTKKQCLDVWGMPERYYKMNIEGLQILVLDGNDSGSPTHKGRYPSFVGTEQQSWLREQLSSFDRPFLVVSHQPLAGPGAVDNAKDIQAILGGAADKIILAVNGHTHIDHVLRAQKITHLHWNSASYQWVGAKYKHESYAKEVHARHPGMVNTCPYRDAVFGLLTIEPETLTVRVEGRRSEWVGKSPAELGADLNPDLTPGEEIWPGIRDRRLERVAK
jgi:predicted phosphodiesterase